MNSQLYTVSLVKDIAKEISDMRYRNVVYQFPLPLWKLPQTLSFKTTHVYYLTVLEVRSPKIKVSAALHFFRSLQGENLFPCLLQLLEAICIPWFVAFLNSNLVTHHLSNSLTSTSIVTSPSLILTLLLLCHKDSLDYR